MLETMKLTVGDDGIAMVVIDVPGSNANVMNPAFCSEFAVLLDQLAGDSKIRGVVFTSAKNDFVAGGDLKNMVREFNRDISVEEAYRMASPFSPLLRRMEKLGKPIAAAINGAAMGGGLELALACHYRVVANLPKAIVGLPEATLGLMPGAGGTQRLPRLIGIRAALPLILQGTPLSPEKALAAGIVHAVVAPEEVVETARRWILDGGEPTQPWDRPGYVVPGGAGFDDPDLCCFYNASTTNIAVETRGNYPAPLGVLTAVIHGAAVPIEAGLHIESCEFAKLVLDPVALNMVRTMFVSKGELEKLKYRPANIPPANLKTIGVIGAGLMGGGVAHVSALAGLDVIMIDATAAQAEAGLRRISDNIVKQVKRGKMAQDKADAIMSRIKIASEYSALAPCDLVVEAVFEDTAVKAKVFAQALAVLRPDAIIASNTSAIPISTLAETVLNPERFIGLHFFSPVDRMSLVEIIKGKQTNDSTLAHALDYIKLLRKTPIIVNDAPGFFTTRTIAAYVSEAIGMLKEGISPTLIDNVARSAGYPIGPLSMIDDISIELSYHAETTQKQMRGADWVEPYMYSVIKALVEAGRTGRRAGAGFYDYVDGERRPWLGIGDVFPVNPNPPTGEEIKTRLMFAECMEAARAFEQGVVINPAEPDVGSLLGIGFPSYTGGVFSWIDTVGIDHFVATCDRLADAYGERYRPSPWLRARAERMERFYPRSS